MPNVFVCSPLVLPPFGARWRRELNRRIFLPLLLRKAQHLNFRDPLVWSYLPNDTTLDLILSLRRSTLVYYCVADFTQLTPHIEELRAAEGHLIRLSDVVFANCSALAKRCLSQNSNVHVFPIGVNLEAFPLEDEETSPTANEHLLIDLPQPIIGYVGGMHRHVDFDLLKEMAAARPAWSWVFVGAMQSDAAGLGELPNVHLLGQKPHDQLASYIRRFDVCIVPYVNNAYTETVVPTKINEYLAMGKPVVSTDLPTVCEFNAKHRVLTTAPARADDFLLAIEKALRLPKDRATELRRRRVAELYEWGAQLESMSSLIEESEESSAAKTKGAGLARIA
jgi:glycosyltransferase involved in cell wall biosynthesis